MHRAVFLDRDGVINRERGEHTWRASDMEILTDVPEALKELVAAGWLLVVITNQSGIGSGLYGHADVARLHKIIESTLSDHGVKLAAIYYCPHHPQQGKCLCRKPGSLLFEKAMARLRIDPARSVMIGDRHRDIEAAQAVGIRGILVEANEALLPVIRMELLKK